MSKLCVDCNFGEFCFGKDCLCSDPACAHYKKPITAVVGVCREDNPADVDEAYGAGTYARLFPQDDNE
jgi:hypothetical protein